jgi:hypothetical protein
MPTSISPKLEIFSSAEFVPEGVPHVALLYPFWGFPDGELTPDIYADYISIGSDLFDLTEPQHADFFVLPFDWRFATPVAARTEREMEFARAGARRLADLATDLGKNLVVFYVGDTDEEVPLPNALVFSTSLRRGQRSNERAMAVFFEDFVSDRLGAQLPIRPKLARPSVGFCGFAGYRLMPDAPLRRKIRRAAKWLRDGFPGPTARELAIASLRRNSSVVTDFVLQEYGKARESYVGMGRDVFIRNLLNNDYMLCARGSGNWSIRFYEALAFGRIPIFVDTESVLPYDFELEYREFCLWANIADLDHLADQLAAFHDTLGDSTFIDLQHACRRTWEEWLTPEGFFSNFHRHFNRD